MSLPESAADLEGTETAQQIRGSSLLLVGRVLSVGLNFATQVILVRYLTKLDYGIFAYALSLAVVGQTIVTFGLDRTLTRFASIYDEQRRFGLLLGTVAFQVATVTILGAVLLIGALALQGWLATSLIQEPGAAKLLVLLLLLAPIQALDDVLVGLFAVFHQPQLIFVRRHVLAPGLRLATVALLIFIAADLWAIAAGYVVAAAIGLALYLPRLVRLLRDQEVFTRAALSTVSVPYREILGFAVPLLTTDLVYVLMNASDVVLLGYFHHAEEVAKYRVVMPAAHLNQLVFTAFTLLFTPVASRLFARADLARIRQLYWQTAIWMAVCSFPIFAVTFSLADPITVLLYGERYRGSGVILALLSFGYYFNVALGFNGLTLRVFGKVRYTVVVNVITAIANVGLNLLLIPRFGAVGAGIATASILVLHNVLKQLGLRFGTGISLFDPVYLPTYLSIAAGAGVVYAFYAYINSPLYVDLGALAVVSIAIFIANRRLMHLSGVFPELRRLPILGRFLA
jgi:O-antigen/teichoic acid export membrane protein